MGELTDPELKDIIDYINIQVKGNGREISNKGRKGNKINDLCKLFGVESTYLEIKRKTKRKVKSPKTLKELTKVMLKTFNKNVLDAIYASYKWPQAKQRWLSEVPVADTISVKDTGYSFHPLYSPEKVLENGKEMLQVQCLDGHHIRTNIRAKLCKDGTENLRKKAWSEVAKTKKTKLSLAMLEVNKDGKILDQQSDRYVRTMFCEDVEKELRNIGYDVESEFTKLFRQWHEAEDLPGILAVERCRRALALREWLLKEVCLEEFPPPGMYIKGFPKVTFEGLVCSIEAHIYMYELCMKGTYNWRSMTTLVAENLFGEVSEMESHNNGVPSGDSFRRNLAVMAGLNAVRLKPDRPFCMQTAKSRAYPVPKTEQISDAQTGGSTKDPYSIQKLTNICPRNHEFDLRETMGTGCVIGTVKGPFEVPRGVKPVRSHYAVDESKLLWSSRINEESDAF